MQLFFYKAGIFILFEEFISNHVNSALILWIFARDFSNLDLKAKVKGHIYFKICA